MRVIGAYVKYRNFKILIDRLKIQVSLKLVRKHR